VVAVEIDPRKVELARHNARIYGVEDMIEFVVGALLENTSLTTMAQKLLVVKNVSRPPHGGNQAPEYF
jgi:predicted O-methyltransferase YrrM